MRLPFQELKQAMHIAKHPKVGNLLVPEGEERGACPLDHLAGRRVAEEISAMNAMKPQAREDLLIFDH